MRKPTSFYFFKREFNIQQDRYEIWREAANLLTFTPPGLLRVAQMIFYYTVRRENVALTPK